MVTPTQVPSTASEASKAVFGSCFSSNVLLRRSRARQARDRRLQGLTMAPPLGGELFSRRLGIAEPATSTAWLRPERPVADLTERLAFAILKNVSTTRRRNPEPCACDARPFRASPLPRRCVARLGAAATTNRCAGVAVPPRSCAPPHWARPRQ